MKNPGVEQELARLREIIKEYREKEKKLTHVAQFLRDSELRFRLLLEKISDGYFVCKPDGRILDINTAGMKLLGYLSKEELLSTINMHDLYQNPANLERYNQLMVTQGYVKDYELILKKRDGSIVLAFITAIGVKDKYGRTVEYRGILSDDTERVKGEMKIKQMDVELMVAHQELELLKSSNGFRQGGKPAMDAREIGNELFHTVGKINNNFHIMKNSLHVIGEYVRSLEWLVNHIQDYDETIFLVNEIQRVQNLRKNKNLDFLIEDTENLLKNSSNDFNRITSVVTRLKHP
jgi:PAS domain S-box-containing protein